MSRGFTLTDMTVVLAVTSALTALAVPSLQRAVHGQGVRAEVQKVVRDLRRVRTAVRSKASFVIPPTSVRSPGEVFAAKRGGVTVESATSYSVFVGGSQRQTKVLDVVELRPSVGLEIVTPAVGDTIRFRSNGTLAAQSNARVVLRDVQTGERFTIEVAFSGIVDDG